ncbi:MAG: HK97 family phage prohead protease [Clostridiales bacterium]|nr:HK97 family phage prohead protease [Clostridiales bacterium]
MKVQRKSLNPQKLKDEGKSIWRRVNTEVTIHDEEKRIVEGRINTDDIDAYRTVLEPRGAKVEPFMNYGSVLFNHSHNDIIGQAIEVEQQNDHLRALWQFVEPGLSEEIDKIWRLYKNDWIQGYSVGALPLDWETQHHDDIDEDILHFTEWELKEYSLVAVPANPYALARNAEASQAWDYLVKNTAGTYPILDNQDDKQILTQPQVDTKTPEDDGAGAVKDIGDRKTFVWTERALDDNMKTQLAVREVPSYQDLPIAEVDSWDGDAADEAMKKWAGGPDKDEIDWDKYFKGHFYRDGDNPEQYGSYKLPYGIVIDGTLKAADRGVMAVAAVLEGAQGGVDVPSEDEASIRNQVEKYYNKMDETAPWNEDSVEIKTIEDELRRCGVIEDNSQEVEEMKEEEIEKMVEEKIEEAFEGKADDIQKSVVEGVKEFLEESAEEEPKDNTDNEGEETSVEDLEERMDALEEKHSELHGLLEIIADNVN